MSSPWTRSEEHILKRDYREKHFSEMPIQRSVSALRCKARRMGINVPPARNWTKAEIEILKKNYPHSREPLVMPGRTAEAVETKAQRLGLKLTKESASHRRRLGVWKGKKGWKPNEYDTLMRWYPSEGTACQSRLRNRTKDAIRKMASHIGVKFGGKK